MTTLSFRASCASDSTVPQFFYGTAWKEEDTARCVRNAIQAGFRAIDTANQRKHYFEEGVGTALQELLDSGFCTRQELFLQTKFTYQRGQDHRLPYDPKASLSEQVRQSFSKSLEHLKTHFIDSYLLHGPWFNDGISKEDLEVWTTMEQLVEEKKVRFLGISNVDLEQLEVLLTEVKIRPSFVQNRCFARTGWDFEVRKFCQTHKIHYQGFSLLTANLSIFRNPQFLAAIRQANCTPAQAIFRFALDVGMLPLTGTTNPNHMKEDLASFDISLPEQFQKTLEFLFAL